MRRLTFASLALLALSAFLPSAYAQDGGGDDPVPVEKTEVPAETEVPSETEGTEETEGADADEGASGEGTADDGGADSEEAGATDEAITDKGDPSQRDLSAYRLRVGDTLDIQVYQHEEFSREYTVPGDGQVSFHPIGKIELLEKTVFEVEAEINRRLREEEILTEPRVSVVVVKYSPRTVFLIGAVQGTVPLPIHKNVRILELMAMAGGLGNPAADFSRVRIRRRAADGTTYPIHISVADILERNDEQKNVIVFEGDVIYVPTLEAAEPLSAEWVYILGKVRTPGRHALTKGRTSFTLTKLIALAGDFDEFANRSKVTIIRKTDTGRTRFVVDFDEIIEGERPDVDLQADDLIYVPETFF